MNKCFLVLLLVFVSSCRDYADVVIDNQGTSVEWYTGGVDSVTVTPWRVGKYRKQLLSMGARIKIELPAVKGSDIRCRFLAYYPYGFRPWPKRETSFFLCSSF